MKGGRVIGWIVLGGFFVFGLIVSALLAARWGRGSHTGMSREMESESASYMNYSRGPHVGF